MSEINFFETHILSLKKQPQIKKTSVLTVQGKDGSFQIYSGHAPLIAILKSNDKIILENIEGREEIVFHDAGIIKVQDNKVIIFNTEK